MKRCWLVGLILMFSLSYVSAQSAADASATREDVVKLFETMKIHEQMRLVMESVVKQQRTMIHENLKKRAPQISEQELTRLDQLTSEVMKDMPLDSLLDDMIAVYQKHLNRVDVDAMNSFYSSVTGQKLLREMPAMTAESMQAASPRMQAMMDKMMQRLDQMVSEDIEKDKKPAPATNNN